MNSETSKKLVLIVGAGASKEVGLPIGSELKATIAKYLDIRYQHGFEKISGDDVINSAFREYAKVNNPERPDINPYLEAGWRVRDAMPLAISIDNFIDSHRNEEKIAVCGKLAIARAILAAEAGSKLHINKGNIYNKLKFSSLEATWFVSFFRILTENCQVTDLPQRLSKVAIITFNYDRCIEHFLFYAFQHYYQINADHASSLLDGLEIHHPYGAVGKLPWQNKTDGFEFGADPHFTQLIKLAAELRTFCEGIDPSKSDIVAIRSTLASASNVSFLGFAFHKLNLKLLFADLPDGQRERDCSVYGTAYGISSTDLQQISSELSNAGALFRNRIFLRNDLTSAMLFQEFGRSLSLQ
jgi:hypothetical protein